MKKFVSFLFLSTIMLSGCSLKLENDEQTEPVREILISAQEYNNTIDLASSVAPAIVGISAETNGGNSVGSGVCIAENGVIITNSHVVNGSDLIVIYLSNGDTANATLLWEDTVQDLAIIKANKSIPHLPISNENNLNVGEDVVAVGTPLSLILKHSFTKGIVSALNRTLRVETNYGESYMQNLIQHDASLNPGNSGGALVNSQGQVIGINTVKVGSSFSGTSVEGLGFAIPSDDAVQIIDKLIKDKKIVRPYIGISGINVDETTAKRNNIPEGVYVAQVIQNSPAAKAGITKGDVIIGIEGTDITTMEELNEIKNTKNVGDKITLKIYKQNEEKEVKVTLESDDTTSASN
jgi:serine protease Do